MENKKNEVLDERINKTKRIKMLENKIKKATNDLLIKRDETFFIQAILMEEQFYEKGIYWEKDIERFVCDDLPKKLKNSLWRSLYSHFNANGFEINLSSRIDNDLYKIEKELSDLDPKNQTLNAFNVLNNDVCYSIGYLQVYLKKEEIDVFNLLIENEQFDKLSEIITSPYTSPENIKYLMNKILRKHPEQLKRIFTTIPDVDYFKPTSEERINKDKLYQDLVVKQLKNALDEDYFTYFVYDFINNSNREAISYISTILDYGLVDYKNTLYKTSPKNSLIGYENPNFEIKDSDWISISMAAAAYGKTSRDLSDYLYNLDHNKELDPIISICSDLYILETFIYPAEHIDIHICGFLQQKNFVATLDNFKYFHDLLLKRKNKKYNYISENELDDIINLFLKKAKKEDLEDMVKFSVEFKYDFSDIKTKPLSKIAGNFTNNEKAKQKILTQVKKEI